MAVYKFTDIFDQASFKKGFQDINKQLDLIHKNMTEIKTVKMQTGAKESAKSLKSLNKMLEALQAQEKELIAIQKKRLDLVTQGEKAATAAINKEIQNKTKAAKQTKNLTLEETRRREQVKLTNKQLRQQAQLEVAMTANLTKEARSIKELRVQTNQMIKIRDSLNIQTKTGATEFKKLTTAISTNQKQLLKYDQQIGRSQRNVGNYKSAIIGLKTSFGNLMAAFGLVGGLMMFVQLIKQSIKTMAEFEKANSELAAILGTNTEEMAGLTEQAKELASTSAFMASEIIELDTELAKLGFTLKEIENAVPGVSALAAATGTDLADAASTAGAVIRQFSLDASEAARVSDVLALSTSSSALDMEKLATAMPIVGTTAANAGISLERTVALLGTLSNRGLDASSSATALRNMFLELSKTGLTWEEAMQKILTSTDQNAAAFELFGKRGATAGVIMANTEDSILELQNALIDSEDAAQTMADTMLDNLSGDVTLAKSAWEAFILSLNEGENSMSNMLRQIVQFGSSFIQQMTSANRLSNVITQLVATFKDLFKGISTITTTFQNISNVFNDVANGVNTLAPGVDDLGEKADSAGGFIEFLGTALNIILAPTKVYLWVLTKLIEGFSWLIDKIRDYIQNNTWIQEKIKPVIELFKTLTDGVKSLAGWLGLINEKTQTVADTQNKLADVTRRTSSAASDMVNNLTILDEELDDTAESVDGLTDSMQDLLDQFDEMQKLDLARFEQTLLIMQLNGEEEKQLELELTKFKKEQAIERLAFLRENLSAATDSERTELENLVFEYEIKMLEIQSAIDEINIKSLVEAFEETQELALKNFEFEMLLLEEKGATEEEITKATNEFKKQQAIEYLQFLEENGDAATEIEKQELRNLIKALELELADAEQLPFLQDLLGLNDEDFAALQAQAKEFLAAFETYLTEGLKLRKDAIDEELKLSEKRLEQLNKDLEEEQNKKALGVAYDERLLQQKIKNEKAAQEQLLQDRKNIERKQKAIDITKATIGVAQAVVNALQTQPFLPLGLIMSSLAAATGALQIANIVRAKYYEGTEFLQLNGAPKGRDTIPGIVGNDLVLLNEGERIVKTSINDKIPRNFPNDMLPEAVSYFIKRKNIYNDAFANILDTSDIVKEQIESKKYLKEIAQNSKNNKVYKDGRLIRETVGSITYTYG